MTPMKLAVRTLVGFVLCAAACGGCLLCVGHAFRDSGDSEAETNSVRNTASAELQKQRAELIQKWKNLHVIQNIDAPATDPHLHVLPAFHLLTFAEKQSLVGLCYAWYFGLPKETTRFNGFMHLIDAMTNKRIGIFTLDGGLTLY